MAINNWDRKRGAFDELKQGGHVNSAGRGEGKLTREQKTKRRIEKHYARQGFRNYGGARISYASVVFQETLVTIFAVMFYGVILAIPVLGLIGIAASSYIMAPLIFGTFFVFLIAPHAKRLFKRLGFMNKLKRLCKKRGLRLYIYRNMFRTLYSPGYLPDFAAESAGVLYEVMFFPSPKRLSVLRFERAGEVTIVTGILKNRFKDALGMHERVRTRPCGFEASGNIKTKKVKKILLLNPVPYAMYYYDKKDGRVVQGGSGTEFFGYTAYSGNGFLNTLEREAD